METLVDLLRENPLLLLFLVAAVGYPLGRVRFGGASLGVAAVLFVGLGAGALHPDLKLPEVVYTLGLVLFVYTIGLSSGSIFFTSLRSSGLRYNLLVVGGVLFAGGLAVIAHLALRLRATFTAGLFAGALTNTPALAGVLEHVKQIAPAGVAETWLSEPVIAYSLSYPMGVLGMILAMFLLRRLWKVDFAREAEGLTEFGAGRDPLESRTVEITRQCCLKVADLVHEMHWNVIFGRVKHDGKVSLATGQTVLNTGDLISLVGTRDVLDIATAYLGEAREERLEFDLTQYDKRRFVISAPEVPGRRLRELGLMQRFGAVVTRVRRGDVELLPHGDTILSLGDQVRVVAPHDKMENIASVLGDSYKAVSEIDILTFSLGLALGLALGMVPIPLPGGMTIKLGVAGGPLLVALVLGALGRSGPMVWELPYSANLTLRQIGLVLFLAGVGTRSGYAFFNTLASGTGLPIFLAGAGITFITSLLVLWVGHRVLQIPLGLLMGITAGMQTQPAVLGYALEQTENDLPNLGYASVYPVAMITKIILAQLILALFMG
ncbi:MAG TPA: aspartate:alanine exchanger family transporter [Anaerolineaceae bacterium]